MSYVHCVWMPLKIQFRDSVECRLRNTSSTDSWITSKCFMYYVDVIYLADLVVRHLPDFSVFQFWLGPCVEYFANSLKPSWYMEAVGLEIFLQNAQLPALDFQSNCTLAP